MNTVKDRQQAICMLNTWRARITTSQPLHQHTEWYALSGTDSMLSVKTVPEYAKFFFIRWSELLVKRGYMLCGTCVVVPKKLQDKVLDKLYCNNLVGILKRLRLAKGAFQSKVWKMCLQSLLCIRGPGQQSLAAGTSWFFLAPSRVRCIYVIMVGAHSKWPDVSEIGSTMAKSTIAVLQHTLTAHGLPLHLVSDNGLQFDTDECKQYLEANWVKHIHCAPYHSSSNWTLYWDLWSSYACSRTPRYSLIGSYGYT